MNEKTLPLTITGLAIVMSLISGVGFFMAKEARDKFSALESKYEKTGEFDNKLLARLEELDAGMVALAKLSKVDGAELSKLMAIELGEIRNVRVKAVPASASTAEVGETNTIEMAVEPMQIAEPVRKIIESKDSTASLSSAPVGDQVAQPPTVKEPKSPVPTQDFEAIVKKLQTDGEPGEQASNPKIKTKPLQPMTMALVDQIIGMQISDQWHKPPGATDGRTVEVHINMSRDGKLDKVSITRSSGNAVFDNSAVTALKSIGVVKEVALLDDATYEKAYRSRSIVLK